MINEDEIERSYKNEVAAVEKSKESDNLSAQMDYLTGFLNRRGLYEYFDTLGEDVNINFMFLDIDNFKGVNDTYGHAMGDKLLVGVSRMIKKKIGDSLLARIGGDEFVIMPVPEMSEQEAAEMAQNIINSVNDIEISFEIKSIISFSIGIVMDQKKSMGLDTIMPKCDAAMYEAKRRGKNGYVLYSTIENIFEMKQTIDRDKTRALQNGEFEVKFIPVMNISSFSIVCSQAYVVWNRKDTVYREELFKEFFEENGFIIELENYVFEQLCRLISQEKELKIRKIPIIFTTSSININRINYADELLKIADKYGISSENFVIQLERINERIDIRRIQSFFRRLKAAGFATAIHDFGSGGSSIMIIKDIPLDYVGIGKNITDNLLRERKDSLFVKNILSLINDLNLETVVDGIDDSTEVKYLISYGCTFGSGRLFSDELSYQEYREFAERNIPDSLKSIRFRFADTLSDETGRYQGRFLGEGSPQFVYDEYMKRNVLYLPGGKMMTNVIELPAELMDNTSYSIVIKYKMNELTDWSSLLYIMYDNGFMSFMPYAWTGISMYRIKDDMEEDGWNDALGTMSNMEWHTAVLTYSHKNEMSRFYMDGKDSGFRDKVLTLVSPRRLIIGGDVYAHSCEGYIAELRFYDYVLNKKDIEACFGEQRV